MSVQVFRGRTMEDARRAALEKLGPAAVVVTTRTIRRPGLGGLFGGSEVEIAALPQDAPVSAPPPVKTESDAMFAPGVYADAPKTVTGGDVAALRAELKGDIRALKAMLAKVDAVPDGVASEIAQLRELVEAMTQKAAPKQDKGTAALRELGIEGPAATAVGRKLRKAQGDLGAAVKEELRAILRVGPWPLESERSLIALVGPSGVGKTTTAAKLAARARMAGRSVTLIACDTYRVGAVEQLSRYAELLGVEWVKAKTADELRGLLETLKSDVVIVDTSGRPPTPDGVETALVSKGKAPRGARARHVFLCVPASIRANDVTRVVRRYAPLSSDALVITKIDETDTPAGIVHSAWASKLPVSVLCNGQRVPEDIAPATADALTAPFTLSPEEPAATT